jgi:hypothetical protein
MAREGAGVPTADYRVVPAVGLQAELRFRTVTNPSQSAEGQPGAEAGAQSAPPPPPPPPDRSWIEFDDGISPVHLVIRNQGPGVIERMVIERGN